jgi:Holliday junction resolvase/Zn finger protein HypA/HybF involved in hydrogenase expression
MRWKKNSQFSRTGKAAFKNFQYAQKWAIQNKLDHKITLIIRNAIENKNLVYIRSILRDAGYTEFVNLLRDELGVAYKEAKVGRWTIPDGTLLGLAYPKKLLKCEHCKVPVNRIGLKYCSPKCEKESDKYERAGNTISLRRRDESPTVSASRQRNTVKTNMQKYGVSNPMQNVSIKKKVIKALAARTEEQRKESRSKFRKTLAENFDLDYLPKSVMDVPDIKKRAMRKHKQSLKERGAEIQKRKEETMIQKYGVRHQIYIDSVRDKINKFRRKRITLNGVEYLYQGYENYVLKDLISRGYKVSTKSIPIKYKQNGKSKIYYPDIIARKGNKKLLIEVKSTYTFKWTCHNQPRKLFAGTKWAIARSADFLVIVVNPNKCKMLIFKNPNDLKELARDFGTVIELKTNLDRA